MATLSDATLLAISRISVGTPVTDGTDFTAMTPAQVAAKFALSSYGGDAGSYVYAPGADGDYDALDPDDPPVTDLGLWPVGAFTNYAYNGLLAGAVVGTPGTKPNVIEFFGGTHISVDQIATLAGLPAVTLTAISTAGSLFLGVRTGYAVATEGDIFSYQTMIDYVTAGTGGAKTFWVSQYSPGASFLSVPLDTPPAMTKGTTPAVSAGKTYVVSYSAKTIIEEGVEIEGTFMPGQLVKLPYNPPVLALSAAATTTKLAAITQREVSVWKPFVVVIEATTGKTVAGAYPVLYSLSKDNNNYILLYRSPSTSYIVVKACTDGVSNEFGVATIADNTAFKITMAVCSALIKLSFDNGSTQVFTKKRPGGALILESVGCNYAGAAQWNGSIQSCTLIHPAVYTDEQLEAA